MDKFDKIIVFGGTGLVGSAIIRKLTEKDYNNIIATYNSHLPIFSNKNIKWIKINLLNQTEVKNFFETYKPDYVFLAAAKVGGILSNNIYRADFIYQNIQIQTNVIHYSYLYKVKKLLFLGSTCIYPKECLQPIKEEYLLTSPLEYTNEPYAIAKIAGIKMCESYNLQYGTNFLSVMPTNLYGINDNFDLQTSHVLPALLRKVYLGKCLEENKWEKIKKDLDKNPIEGINGKFSKEKIIEILNKYGVQFDIQNSKIEINIEIWGSGKPMRELLWSDDMADACVFLMENINFQEIVQKSLPTTNYTLQAGFSDEIRNTHINIGTGKDISIKDLAHIIKKIIGFKGRFYFNKEKPDGTFRKITDVSRLHSLGWHHKIEIEEGIEKLYSWYHKS